MNVAEAIRRNDIDALRECVENGANIHEQDPVYGNTPLIYAASEGAIDAVRFIVENGRKTFGDVYDIDVRNNEGWTALWKTCAHVGGFTDAMKMEIIRYLLENGADIEACDYYMNRTPLIVALKWKCTEIAECLIGHGANVWAKQKNGTTALMTAINEGLLSLVKMLVESVPEPDRKRYVENAGAFGHTPLMNASEGGYGDIVDYLVDIGADVNTFDKDGCDAFFYATIKNHPDVISRLVSHGVNPCSDPKSGSVMLERALRSGCAEAIRCLAPVISSKEIRYADIMLYRVLSLDSIYTTAIDNNYEILNTLVIPTYIERAINDPAFAKAMVEDVEKIIDVVWSDTHHNSSQRDTQKIPHIDFATSIRKSFVNRIATELSNNSNIEVETYANNLLLWASTEGNANIVRRLIERNTHLDINIANCDKMTPLALASMNGHLEVVRLLVGAGAKIELPDRKGQTALHHSAKMGHSDVVEFLAGFSDPNIRDRFKWTPFMTASSMNHVDVMKRLVKCGASTDGERKCDIDAINGSGKTALMIAAERHNFDAVRYIFHCGADVNIENVEKQSVFHIIAGNHSIPEDIFGLVLSKISYANAHISRIIPRNSEFPADHYAKLVKILTPLYIERAVKDPAFCRNMEQDVSNILAKYSAPDRASLVKIAKEDGKNAPTKKDMALLAKIRKVLRSIDFTEPENEKRTTEIDSGMYDMEL